eukprot:307724-Chlamydomonas_euryale.AAC.5
MRAWAAYLMRAALCTSSKVTSSSAGSLRALVSTAASALGTAASPAGGRARPAITARRPAVQHARALHVNKRACPRAPLPRTRPATWEGTPAAAAAAAGDDVEAEAEDDDGDGDDDVDDVDNDDDADSAEADAAAGAAAKAPRVMKAALAQGAKTRSRRRGAAARIADRRM